MIYDDLNKVMLTGRLGADIELKYSQSGNAVAKFNIASNRAVKQNDEWKTEVEWTTVVCFGKQAESLAKNAPKGTRVAVNGRLQTSKWQDSEGKDKYKTEVIVDMKGDVHVIRDSSDRQAAAPSNQAQAQNDYNRKLAEENAKQNQGNKETPKGAVNWDDDEDLPF